MEELIPREITSTGHFEEMYPSVLATSCSGSEVTETTAYELADINAINKVSSISETLWTALTPSLLLVFKHSSL